MHFTVSLDQIETWLGGSAIDYDWSLFTKHSSLPPAENPGFFSFVNLGMICVQLVLLMKYASNPPSTSLNFTFIYYGRSTPASYIDALKSDVNACILPLVANTMSQ